MSYKWWVLIAVAVFGAGLALGLNTPVFIANLLSQEIEALKELARQLTPFSIFTFLTIFLRNAASLLLGFVLSPIALLAPILSLIVNGWVLSFLSTSIAEKQSLGFVLAGLLPHGILELPALIISQAAALSFGTAAMRALFNKERRKMLGPNFRKNLKYVLIALALLVPAAAIETYVTPLLLR